MFEPGFHKNISRNSAKYSWIMFIAEHESSDLWMYGDGLLKKIRIFLPKTKSHNSFESENFSFPFFVQKWPKIAEKCEKWNFY